MLSYKNKFSITAMEMFVMDYTSGNEFKFWTDDFFFNPLDEAELVICNPPYSIGTAPGHLCSRKSLEEHIQLVNEKQIKKLFIEADDISFLGRCPSVEEVRVWPYSKGKNLDYSPLYDMPNLCKLNCCTIDRVQRISHIDYSRFPYLESLIVAQPKGHENVHTVRGLKQLVFDGWKPKSKNLVGAFQGQELKELCINASSVTSLEGLEQAPRLESLELSYLRGLTDISAIASVKDTLRKLDIENCGRIKDFSVLSELHHLESLRLLGGNTLPNLSFVRNMPNLHFFSFWMNSADGDLSMCLDIPYVLIQNRRHFSHKNEDFLKGNM